MLGQLFGVKYETREIGSDAEATAELNQIMARERPNRPVLFDIDMGSFNHCVSLEGVRGDHVYYRDPFTGKMESMTKDEFRQ
jgi:predicted double-glycine peptidase